MKKATFLFLYLFASIHAVNAELTVGEQEVNKHFPTEEYTISTVQLWPDKAPDEPRPLGEESVSAGKNGGSRISMVTQPSFTIVRPKSFSATTPAVFVCPGGGYGSLGVTTGGVDVVKWLHKIGITGIYLKYRVPKRHQGYPMHHHPLQDIQRAMSLVRSRADEFSIDPDRIGAIGFSAGGNLVAMLGTHYRTEDRNYEPIDEIDKASCRPDFVMLVAPAYLTMPIDSHELDPNLNIDHLRPNVTPPFFITSATTDKFTIGSSIFALALRKKRVSTEVHFYNRGGHAEGVTDRETNQWFRMAEDWLIREKVIPREE